MNRSSSPSPESGPQTQTLLQIRDLAVSYGRGKSERVDALSDVSLEICAQETMGLVGESGSGKTTLGRALLGLVRPTAGEVLFEGRSVTARSAARRWRGRLQVVLQNPDWSLNPSLKVWRSVSEPLTVRGGGGNRQSRRTAVATMLEMVGLDPSFGDRRPHELSGGQRQRVAIARAIITDPSMIVFDEAVTALDASVQTHVLNLIKDLQRERGFAALFISHDLAAVRYVSHRICVVYKGKVVEIAPVARFYGHPEHPYSQHLLDSLPTARIRNPDGLAQLDNGRPGPHSSVDGNC